MKQGEREGDAQRRLPTRALERTIQSSAYAPRSSESIQRPMRYDRKLQRRSILSRRAVCEYRGDERCVTRAWCSELGRFEALRGRRREVSDRAGQRGEGRGRIRTHMPMRRERSSRRSSGLGVHSGRNTGHCSATLPSACARERQEGAERGGRTSKSEMSQAPSLSRRVGPGRRRSESTCPRSRSSATGRCRTRSYRATSVLWRGRRDEEEVEGPGAGRNDASRLGRLSNAVATRARSVSSGSYCRSSSGEASSRAPRRCARSWSVSECRAARRSTRARTWVSVTGVASGTGVPVAAQSQPGVRVRARRRGRGTDLGGPCPCARRPTGRRRWCRRCSGSSGWREGSAGWWRSSSRRPL